MPVYGHDMTAADKVAVYAEGVAAQKAGQPGRSCPYPYGTARNDTWWIGWWAARAGRA